MQYGYFDNTAKEYVITNPKTPVKWINYVGGLDFGGFVDHTGGSLICKGDPDTNRILKYIPQLPDSDFKGETLYIRIRENGVYKLFSPFYVPTLDAYDLYECRVGLGYSAIVSEFYGIRTQVTIFVPYKSGRVVRDIRITNLRQSAAEIDVIPVVEYSHFEALTQYTNNDWVPQTMQSQAVHEDGGLITLTQYAFMRKDTAVNYLTSNHPVSSFETDRKSFLGDGGYGSWSCPLSLKELELGCCEARRGDNIGALMHHLGSIKPGEEKRIITQLGQCADIMKEKALIDAYRQEEKVDEAFAQLASFWEDYLSHFVVSTPDENFNTMVNIHNPRQCYITKNWSRYLSLYQLGLGSRGIGFRDSSQDVMGILGNMPEEGRALIELLLRTQLRAGNAMHQFNPATMVAEAGDSREMEDRPSYYGDDHLWIVLAVAAYIKESGNTAFLEKQIPFYDKDKDQKPIETGTVLEHLTRAVRFSRDNVGKNGIPLLGFADWNDTVNLPTGAESVFNACLYGRALGELIGIMEHIGDTQAAQSYKQDHADMKRVFNDKCWDGEWYVRYFDHEGKKLGSQQNDKGKIYTNAQSWSVLSGYATEDRAAQALDSVHRLLNTKNGVKLSAPGFDGYDRSIGGITSYPPGAKENGGIFLHSNPWVMIAETMVGNGNRAYQYYNQINPIAKNDIIDEYECEPYVYAQNVLSDEHPQSGLGRNSWLSGTSSWAYQAATKHILGIEAVMDGLKIDPCIPDAWDGFTAVKKFRGAVYHIKVRNPSHVCKGVRAVMVDGSEIEGNVVPVFDDGQQHNVVVVMG